MPIIPIIAYYALAGIGAAIGFRIGNRAMDAAEGVIAERIEAAELAAQEGRLVDEAEDAIAPLSAFRA